MLTEQTEHNKRFQRAKKRSGREHEEVIIKMGA